MTDETGASASPAAVASATVADRHVHPGTIVLRFVKELPSTVLAAPAALAFTSGMGVAGFLLFAGLLAAVMAGVNWLAWSRFRYGVGPGDIVIEKGILNRTRRSIPFDRVQDVDIERRLLQRIFGLAKVRIETGGAGKDEGLIDSVTIAEADRLRAAVRAGKREPVAAAAGAEPAAAPEPEEEELLFAMGPGRVLTLGLFNFSLVYIAGLFALLQTFQNVLPFDIYDPARWTGLVGSRLPERLTLPAILAVLFLALLLGVIAGMATTLSREYGFRLTDQGRRMRRERGLLTHTEAVLGKKRIQIALIQTGPVRVRFGWFALFFQSLGAGSDSGGRQSAAPFAREAELDPILAAAGRFRRPGGALEPVSNRHVLRASLPLALPAAFILAAALWEPRALWLLVLVPLLAARAALQRRYHRYALSDGLLFIQRGVWRRRLWIVPVERVQALGLSRSRPQRWLDLATLTVDTAGAPMTSGARIVDLRWDAARKLAEQLRVART
ncbi:MAG TPA: PH domain-containing protein [Allosphingosinicella sp.]